MRLDEYYVRNVNTGQFAIIAGMHEACDLAWKMYQQDPDSYYVWVEDTFGDTVVEYGFDYNKPHDIVNDCLMSYDSMEEV